MREDTRPSYAASDAVHRRTAGLSYHAGNSGKTHTDKPRDHRPVPQKDKEALRLKGKSLTKPLNSLKSRVPVLALYSSEERKTFGFRQIDTGGL
jgi:hypothetical protein